MPNMFRSHVKVWTKYRCRGVSEIQGNTKHYNTILLKEFNYYFQKQDKCLVINKMFDIIQLSINYSSQCITDWELAFKKKKSSLNYMQIDILYSDVK